jgi:hypothetical protein
VCPCVPLLLGVARRENIYANCGIRSDRSAPTREDLVKKHQRGVTASMWKWFTPTLIVLSIFTSLAPVRPVTKETWAISPDGQTASVSGRVHQPLWKKLNPLWWFLNDDEPDPPDWQLPGKPYILRQLSWYLRNPLQNFGRYVLGVSDRNYTVVGTAPVYAAIPSDVDPNNTGWKFSNIYVNGFPLPFIAYESERVVWYAGWQWWGFFGFKFNIKKSPIQLW